MLLQVFPWPFWSIRRSVAEAWHEAMKQCQNAFQKCLLCLRPITDLIRSHPLISHKFLIIASTLIILHPFSSIFDSLVKVFAVAKCNLDRKVAFSNPEIIYQLKAGVTPGHTDPIAKLSGSPFRLDQFGSKAPGITIQVPGVRTWIKIIKVKVQRCPQSCHVLSQFEIVSINFHRYS